MNLESLFRQILKPALGCTEPVAVALAAASAVQASSGWTPDSHSFRFSEPQASDVREIRMRVSRNIFKNTFAIPLPNTGGRKGMVMAAALGVFCDPREGMNLFRSLDDAHVRAADTLIETRRVKVDIDDDAPDLYIEMTVELASGRRAACIIRDEHANVAWLEQNGTTIYGRRQTAAGSSTYSPEIETLKTMRVSEVLALVDDLPEQVKELLRETVDKNVAACKAGLSRPTGIGAGYFGAFGDPSVSVVQSLPAMTAAGSDARMAGVAVEVMTSAGSGNQGIVATIPVVVYAHMHFIDEPKLIQALALAHLMTMYITSQIGYLSALCGVAIKAGIGAACGVTYAMGGGVQDVERAIKIMAATLSGMICDGAKIGCALKVSSAAEMATRAASLAMRKAEVPDDNGIVDSTAERTILNLAELSRSMHAVDQKLIEIMLAKISE